MVLSFFQTKDLPGTDLDVSWGAGSEIFYADNNGSRVNSTTSSSGVYYTYGNRFNDNTVWGFSRKASITDVPFINKYSKLRIIGGYLKLRYTGKLENLSGILKVSMGFKHMTSSVTDYTISLDNLEDNPQFKV
jgi:hypothetical protein